MSVDRKGLFLALGLVVAIAVPASAGPMKLKLGAAKSGGVVRFALHHAATGDSHQVEVSIPGTLDALPKTTAVATAVAALDATSTWRATVTSTGLTFQHLVNLVWVDVDTISDLVDTTGSGSKLSTNGTVVDFTVDIDPEAMASGVDAIDSPSIITVTLTDTLTWTRSIQYGQTAADLLDQFEAFLREEAGEGVLVVRTSPSAMQITLLYDSSQMNWQVTDTGLQPAAKASGISTDWPAGLIDRRRK
jgi:hypothetical protein